VQVGREGPDDEAREAADGKEEHERQGEDEGRVQFDGTFVEGGHPVEDLDPARHGDDKSDEGKDHARRIAHSAREHVVSPDEVPDAGDPESGKGDSRVAEQGAARKDGDDLTDHPMAGSTMM